MRHTIQFCLCPNIFVPKSFVTTGVEDGVPFARRRTLEGQTHQVAAGALAPMLVEFFAS